jgi:hypothetical protein
MKIRGLAAVAILTTAALASTGNAAVKPCNLLTDAAGDAEGLILPGNDPQMDILSADLATNAKTLTGVIRLAKVGTTNTTGAPGGAAYFLQFNAAGAPNPLYVSAAFDREGVATYSFGQYTVVGATGNYDELGTVTTGVVDTVKNEIRVSVPVTGFTGASIKKGVKLSELEASSTFQLVALVGTIDEATGGKAYTAGGASCVVVGK